MWLAVPDSIIRKVVYSLLSLSSAVLGDDMDLWLAIPDYHKES